MNDAAERLVDEEMAERFAIALDQKSSFREEDFRTLLDEALAAERRATVERIRGAVLVYGVVDIPIRRLLAILDAEAER